ncbi:MAG: AraC family transcriptional regulator [Gammaproteobacteria bacterium]|nr:AraC family transcriptional regulator [Gammaproteobacteria bacterium]
MSLPVDALSDALSSLRISGSLLLREDYAPPWAIAIPNAERLATLMAVKPGTRAVAFHMVEFGHCEITVAGGDPIVIAAGEMVVCFAGVAHRIAQGKRAKTVPVETLLGGGANESRPGALGRARGASLLCGVFLLGDTMLNPLFAALPPLLHASVSRPGEFHNLAGVARLLAQEIDRKPLGGGYVVERLLEVLCAEIIQAHVETGSNAGWLRGIKDPVIGRALAAIHSRPGADWSVQRLAQRVAMSPSRFAASFAATLNESPMAYIAKWRMNLACRLLSGTPRTVSQIAAEVGYENVAAFNRAFKKHVGIPPATWRGARAGS